MLYGSTLNIRVRSPRLTLNTVYAPSLDAEYLDPEYQTCTLPRSQSWALCGLGMWCRFLGFGCGAWGLRFQVVKLG